MGINLNRHEGIMTSNLSLEKKLNVVERSSLRVLQSRLFKNLFIQCNIRRNIIQKNKSSTTVKVKKKLGPIFIF